MNKPIFTISLDFELMWGVFDQKGIGDYGNNVEGVQIVVPKILKLFKTYEIHATWAVVGMLYARSLDELKEKSPIDLPTYDDSSLSAYEHIQTIDQNNFSTFYSGAELLKQIKATKHQELGTHTYSHYYCLEPGQNISQFKADLNIAIEVASAHKITVKSIIFPRNQFNEVYLTVCKENGIIAYRGNEENLFQKPRAYGNVNLLIRAGRLIDSYLSLSGPNVSTILKPDSLGLVDIPASSFFRPFNKKLEFLEILKIRRIKKAMKYAAENNGCFHLWWHPHNFGVNQQENLAQLEQLLNYYKKLQLKYGMVSLNMGEIADFIINE